MKQGIFALVFAFLTWPAFAAGEAAENAVLSWLALIDAGKYAESWDESARYFQSAITREKWIAALQGVREPLGQIKVREISNAASATSLPGAPDGIYVVFTTQASFANKAEAIETVTVIKTGENWKAVGYFIK